MLKVLHLRLARGNPPESPRPPLKDDLGAVLLRSRAGEARALRTLLTALGPAMLQVVRRVLGSRHPDVEDTFQEATLALVQALSTFRGECSARQFACRIATFTAISARRRHKVAGDVPLDDDDDEDRSPRGSETVPETDWVLAARRRELVRHLLDELPVPQAEALVLHSIVGLTVEELASATAVPVETARSRLRLARAALRVRIAGDRAALELTEDLS
jgi:RNA polymerase sigma factor (sigma-70 family)